MDATLGQQIPGNTMIDSTSLSVGSVGSIPNTETPPPGYMSEDGDPMDQNDNMSESLLVSPSMRVFCFFFLLFSLLIVLSILYFFTQCEEYKFLFL